MKKFLFASLFCFLLNILSATTIVIYITPGFVIMAADSKGFYTNAINYQKTSSIVSKIYKSGNVYFSLAGLISNPTRLFDVAKIVNDKFKASSNIDSAIAQAKVEVQFALTTYLTNQKRNNYRLFKNNLTSGTYITSIGIIALKDNKPYAHIIGFRVTDEEEVEVTSEEDFYASNIRDAVYYLGTSEEINKYLGSIRKNNLNAVQFVDGLMNLQIQKTPNLVGAPVDMLRITPKGVEWIRRKKTTPIVL